MGDEMKAPERIWAESDYDHGWYYPRGEWFAEYARIKDNDAVEYVHADLYAQERHAKDFVKSENEILRRELAEAESRERAARADAYAEALRDAAQHAGMWGSEEYETHGIKDGSAEDETYGLARIDAVQAIRALPTPPPPPHPPPPPPRHATPPHRPRPPNRDRSRTRVERPEDQLAGKHVTRTDAQAL
ncbi:hypothetical protein, partial [Roseivivax jejudonensis]|uniref:hypothetical protein n=1 Tax=Roseivivax jejudonensis TaxID=1529041 RepID=UPI001F224F72